MDNLDWSQFTPLDHLIALALIVGWVGLIGLFVALAVKLALRVYSLVLPRRMNTQVITVGRCAACGRTSEQFTQPLRCQHCNSPEVTCDHPSSRCDSGAFVCSWCGAKHGASEARLVADVCDLINKQGKP